MGSKPSKTNCPDPLQVRSAPARRGSRPKPRSGAGPGQVRSGKVESPTSGLRNLVVQGTETALTWRAVNDPVPLDFCTDNRRKPASNPTHSPPFLFLSRFPFPLLTNLRNTVRLLLSWIGFPFFLSLHTLTTDSHWLSIIIYHAAAVTPADCNSSSRYRSSPCWPTAEG